jgi:3-deoxy-manno-octulosonate cytidylyltransferase (CMP-KDO synthetase)
MFSRTNIGDIAYFNAMKFTAIIPARYGSSRFPGKPLALIGGKPMIQHVYEKALSCAQLNQVVVATDDERIMDCVQGFGGKAIMTSDQHLSGTDRVAEVAADLEDTDVVINIQGDEPFVSSEQLDQLCGMFTKSEVQIATLAHPISDDRLIQDPNVVKVVFSQGGRALYFSRSAIPFLRGVPIEGWGSRQLHFQHLGLYAYRKEVLLALTQLSAGSLEQAESLEQLRWLQADYQIYLAVTKYKSMGIDTPEDLKLAEVWWQEQNK